MQKEMIFIAENFADLNKDYYIKNELINDLLNFSNKDKVSKLIQGITHFIDAFSIIKKIKTTKLLESLKKKYEIINSKEVSGEDIKEAVSLLTELGYDIKYLKEYKDTNLEIRNLNEFIEESENSQLLTSDIDNLVDVFSFFNKLMDNKKIDKDVTLLQKFKEEFDKDSNIIIKFQDYLNIYGEIYQLFQSYHENPEMTIQKIHSLLSNSSVRIYKDPKTCQCIFKFH